jgi:23S rRNA (pseudouridine1915-N3)-methyltransferase
MLLRVVAVGKMKDPALRAACSDYVTRIRRYQRLEVVQVKEAKRPDPDARSAREVEGAALLRALEPETRVVALTRSGVTLSSTDLANTLRDWQLEGRDVAFVIGGAHGLADTLLANAALTVSLSAMTLPHELARLVLLEQIYRACTILRGEPYHKGRDA